MGLAAPAARSVEALLATQDRVIAHGQAIASGLTQAQLSWLVTSGRWQRPLPRAFVAHTGPLTDTQRAWSGWACAWPNGVLSCHTAAALDGLRGLADPDVHVLSPPGHQVRRRPGLRPHRATLPVDVHPLRSPTRTRLARSLVDMTLHARGLDDAVAILAAGVQQRLVSAAALHDEVAQRSTLARRGELLAVCRDLAGGSHSVIEVELMRLVRRYALPEPSRQVPMLLPDGLARVDCYWDQFGVVVEVDGRMHMDVSQWRSDLRRQNEITLTARIVLRFPLWALRSEHRQVADQLRRALG